MRAQVLGLILSTALMTPALAAPPASCAHKFIGEWRHSGGNKGTLTADGRAICSEHAACQAEGTWTCSGDSLTYTTSMGSWVYTLQPDGSIATNGGMARAVRIGRAPAAPAKPATAAANDAPSGGNPSARPVRTGRDCSGVSGKVNGVELKPVKCDEAPPKTAAITPAPQPAQPQRQPTSGTAAGSKRALEAIAEISPEFKAALDGAALRVEHAKIDPSRVKEPRTSEPVPPRTEPKVAGPNAAAVPSAAAEPSAPPRAISELDPEDYARVCRDESLKSGLESLKQDIAAATEDVVRQRDPANKRPVRGVKFYAEKYKLIKKVLKLCAVEVFRKQVVDPIEASGIFAEMQDLASDAR